MNKKMNVSTILSTIVITAGLFFFNTQTFSQEQGTAKGGGQKLIQAKPLNSASDAQKLKDGDAVVSACSKCKMMNYTRVDRTAKGGNLGQTRNSGTCPACDVKLSGDSTKHICKMCGEEMMCSVIPAENSEAKQTR